MSEAAGGRKFHTDGQNGENRTKGVKGRKRKEVHES